MKISFIFLTFILFVNNNAAANQKIFSNTNDPHIESATNRMANSNGWFFSGGYFTLDTANADAELIDDEAFAISFGWEGHDNSFVYGLGISGLFLSDNDSFSQVVESNFGGVTTASSTADSFGIFGEVGYSHAFNSSNNSFELLGGFEFTSASRSIANCSNCYSEDINLDSGLYIKPRIRFYGDNGFIFSIAYQHYLSGDIDGGVSLRFSWHR